MTLNEILLYIISLGYHTDASGNLFKKDRVSKANKIHPNGYRILQTKVSGKNVYVPIHRIVAYQKYGDQIFDPCIEVRHLDGNKLNNHPDNIVIGTHSENMFDVPIEIRMHRTRKGALKTRRFSYEEAEQIRMDHSRGLSYKDLSAKYKIGKSTISYIINRKTYSDLEHY
jgi:hypothetical protein